MLWKHSKDGEFSAKSTYLTNISQDPTPTFHGAWIWKLDVLPKIANFLWLCIHKSVPVKDILASRGIIEDKICPLCKNQPKTIEHLLRECDFARNFWHLMSVQPDVVQSFQASDVVTWLRENCFSNAKHQSSVPWRFVFPFAIWELWKHRNKVSFKNNPLNPMLCRLCINQAMEYYFCVGKIREQRSMAVIIVRWKKPPLNWYKLNTDGASCVNLERVGGGGVVRDSAGNWIKGFARYIGYTTSIIAAF